MEDNKHEYIAKVFKLARKYDIKASLSRHSGEQNFLAGKVGGIIEGAALVLNEPFSELHNRYCQYLSATYFEVWDKSGNLIDPGILKEEI